MRPAARSWWLHLIGLCPDSSRPCWIAVPKRTDIKRILLIGSGPIVIGQACEFDYSGTQACKALREEGYEVVLVNSNPATIMTDPDMADRTYIEPLTWEIVEKVIERERPDAILPTLGGQTGLNLAMDLARHGVLEKYGVEMIGARPEVIDKAEDRAQFKAAMEKIGLECCRGETVKTVEDARRVMEDVGLPAVVRPSFTLGGSGSAIAYNTGEFDMLVRRGLDQSPVHEVLIEESILGWKEYEMEVMRDMDDNVVIICSIENFDPMGVHTGDSITVAPAQTLTDKEYQRMRDASLAVIREIGVETGGSNIQFATHPQTGRMIVIEMNPRVSRSSALASKATGFPDRQDRRQAGRRLSAARAGERHHAENEGLLRADDRLRRDQGPAIRLRKIPGSRRDADDADEERRRDDGDRPHVQGVVSEGASRPGSRQLRLRLRQQGQVGHRRAAGRGRNSRQALGAECRPRLVPAICDEVRHVASSRFTT